MFPKLVQWDLLELIVTSNVLYQRTDRTVSRSATVMAVSAIMSTAVDDPLKVSFL